MSPNPTAHQWQACSQLLPENGQRVLVYRKPVLALIRTGHITISQCRHTASGPIWDCDQNEWAVLPTALFRRVTHWMPLPAEPVMSEAA